MSTVKWTDDLALGIDNIDSQHKGLIDQINALYNSGHAGKGKEAVGEVINFLDRYTTEHFRDEEKLMREHNYPDYEAHVALHAGYLKRFQELKVQFAKEGPTLPFLITVNRTVMLWWVEHIRKADKAYAAHIVGKK